MEIIVPDYYKKFHCIAEKCRHNCCIGWEIDIDSKTLDLYRCTGGEFGERLRQNITHDNDGAHFTLDENEHCPFLNSRGLCDIFTSLGENHLCQICTDHPRFRNFYSDRTEVGLGLCCEEACRIILGSDEKFSLANELESASFDEALFFEMRRGIFDILQNRSISIDERIKMVSEYSADIPEKTPAQWAEIYSALEHLDPQWQNLLESMANFNGDTGMLKKFDTVFEQLVVYFIYRHYAGALDDGKYDERIAFSLLSTKIIAMLCAVHAKKYGTLTFEDIVDFARMYSCEIEYSEENIQALLEIFI